MVGALHARGLRKLIELHLVARQPRGIGPARRKLALQLGIGDNAARHQIHQEHFPRLQAALPTHFLRLHRKHAGL